MTNEKNDMKITYTSSQLPKVVADTIIPILESKHIITLQGPMGAGKTTLVKELLKQCGVTQTVISPTFGYVYSYKSKIGKRFYHFDLYRLSSIEEFLAAGFDEYFYKKNAICLIEWPEIISDLTHSEGLLPSLAELRISYNPDVLESRIIEIS